MNLIKKYIFIFVLVFVRSISIQAQSEAEVFTMVEQMPEFVGGESAMMSFIESNINYPEQEKLANIQGVVYVSFIVNEVGKVINVKVIRGMNNHPNFDKETLAMMNKMPNWKPGKQNGKPVSVQYTLPIKFALPKK